MAPAGASWGRATLVRPVHLGLLADAGSQLLVRGFELVESRLGVAGLAAGDVCGEIFDMDLESCSVGPQEIQGQVALHDDECRPVAVAPEYDLHRLLVWLVRVLGQDTEPSRGIAFLDAPDAFPPARIDASAELATGSQLALDLCVPAGEALAIGQRRPQFIDPRLE